jgi:DNA polymerase III sliding clamp (beta) subunit (PCNA family)
MTAIESRKIDLISAIIDDQNEDRVFEIERLYSQEPCVYSDDELKATVFRRLNDYDDGKTVGIPHNQMKRKIVV